MSVVIPPQSIFFRVEQMAPGVYRAFITRLISAASVTPFTVTVTSWWRGPSENLHAGGSPDSQHLIGLGIDLAPSSGQLVANLTNSGLIAIDEGDHVHVQAWPAGVARSSGVLASVGV